jgi:PleD family two-component response regulator
VSLLVRDEELERALDRANDALYRTKTGGRNPVQIGLSATR